MQAEVENRPFTYSGLDPNLSLAGGDLSASARREYNFKLENYQQKVDSLTATIARASSDIASYATGSPTRKSLETDAPANWSS